MKLEPEAGQSEGDTAESHFSSFAAPLVAEASAHAMKLRANADAEVLHKLRIALRRLRSLLWAYRPLLDSGLDDRQRQIFKQLAGAAGRTRDWDILIELLSGLLGSDQTPIDRLKAARSAACNDSRETLSHAGLRSQLEDAIKSSSDALRATHKDTPLKKFVRKRLQSAERSLHKRMRHASREKHSDYGSYHEVRKAGKKVRYLMDFFAPMLSDKQLKSAKALKRIQKRFGALNDVVASEGLVNDNCALFNGKDAVSTALKALNRERRRRVKAAGKLLK